MSLNLKVYDWFLNSCIDKYFFSSSIYCYLPDLSYICEVSEEVQFLHAAYNLSCLQMILPVRRKLRITKGTFSVLLFLLFSDFRLGVLTYMPHTNFRSYCEIK